MKTFLTRIPWIVVLTLQTAVAVAGDNWSLLARDFAHPSASARPWVYWFWLNGNITSNGVTADLEAMQRAGIGGVLIMEVDQGTPTGPVPFGQPAWRDLFKHVCAEAHRLVLEVNMNNDAGWCGSGGPWITPDLAMQKLVWTETLVEGPREFAEKLPQPKTVSDYYRDIAVLAFPASTDEARIDRVEAKAAFTPERLALENQWPPVPPARIVRSARIVDITKHMERNGSLSWDVPTGKWMIVRLGHTPTGKDNHPAPEAGRGLESDKLSKKATEIMFNGLMGKLISDSKPLAGKTLVATHIDSWETESQNWTPLFREEFKKRRGYDPLRFILTISGRVVDSPEISERFLWDLRRTVSDLLVENYANHIRELAHRHGLRLSIEAYDGAPCDEMTYAGCADEPMAEFWSWGYNTAYSCTEMSSVAHVYGRRILGAEAFTATDGEKWLLHPASIKALGDWAFCEGINRFVFHRYALQPWREYAPGMSMGPWGLHYERTQTWWDQSAAWHEYLSRCQFLLRQGNFVADICFLEPEGSPMRFSPTLPGRSGNTPDRPGYNFDGCTPEVVMKRMKVKDGKLVLPDGMSYRALVLPQIETMTPALLRAIGDLVKAGATVIGPPPSKSPSLSDYPRCDREVKRLADELWGAGGSSTEPASRTVGKGRIVWSDDFKTPRDSSQSANPLQSAKWIWHNEGNPAVAAPPGERFFRRLVALDTGVASARMVLTADNAFELWVDGQRVGEGDDFKQTFTFDIKRLLKPGTNLIAVTARNGADSPNPAGLIGGLRVQYLNGASAEVVTDAKWESATRSAAGWFSDPETPMAWAPAMALGSVGMAPWGVPDRLALEPYVFPNFNAISNLLAAEVPMDFECGAGLRFIHRRDGEMDIFFVANPVTNWLGATCAFRVADKSPELWDPMTGDIRRQVVYEQTEGRTLMPLWLEPSGSIFVVFRPASKEVTNRVLAIEREGQNLLPKFGFPTARPPAVELFTANGGGINVRAWEPGRYVLKTSSVGQRAVNVAALPAPIQVTDPWEVRFEANRGAPDRVILTNLISWSEHSNPGIRYFSGHAVYRTTFESPKSMVPKGRVFLDLGRVAVIAQLKVNGRDLGILWKPPYQTDVTDTLHPGNNRLEIQVVNLWINRMIGDEQLPEDSDRNSNGTLRQWPVWVQEGKPSPTGRFTFTSWRLWKKDSPLQESGLLGPVRLVFASDQSL